MNYLLAGLLAWMDGMMSIEILPYVKLKDSIHIITCMYYFVVRRIKAVFSSQIAWRHLLNIEIEIYHPLGIVLGRHVVVGKNVTIYSHVVFGRKSIGRSGYPIVGNNVIIYTGAMILGNVHVGDNSVIGAGCIIRDDVPAGATVKLLQEKVVCYE
jgi:serine acetyltransferase